MFLATPYSNPNERQWSSGQKRISLKNERIKEGKKERVSERGKQKKSEIECQWTGEDRRRCKKYYQSFDGIPVWSPSVIRRKLSDCVTQHGLNATRWIICLHLVYTMSLYIHLDSPQWNRSSEWSSPRFVYFHIGVSINRTVDWFI